MQTSSNDPPSFELFRMHLRFPMFRLVPRDDVRVFENCIGRQFVEPRGRRTKKAISAFDGCRPRERRRQITRQIEKRKIEILAIIVFEERFAIYCSLISFAEGASKRRANAHSVPRLHVRGIDVCSPLPPTLSRTLGEFSSVANFAEFLFRQFRPISPRVWDSVSR